MAVEAAVALAAAWMARSPALLAFGGDSAIELVSAVVVLRRFRVSAAHEQAESHAARIAGVLLFGLAAYVVVASAMTLLGHGEPKQSLSGDCRVDYGRDLHAVACERETAVVGGDGQCRTQSRRG